MDTAKKVDSVNTFITTVAENKNKYSSRDYSAASSARRLQTILGFPTTRTLASILDNGLLPNCPITSKDLIAADDIFGPPIPALKGKTVRRTPAIFSIATKT
jgi:hypothetical protein